MPQNNAFKMFWLFLILLSLCLFIQWLITNYTWYEWVEALEIGLDNIKNSIF